MAVFLSVSLADDDGGGGRQMAPASLRKTGGEALAFSPLPCGICFPAQLAVSIRHSHVRIRFAGQNRRRLLQFRQGGFWMFQHDQGSSLEQQGSVVFGSHLQNFVALGNGFAPVACLDIGGR